MRNVIIAVDPGYTTGLCVGVLGTEGYDLLEAHALHWSNRYYIAKLIDKYQHTLLKMIVEEFRLFNNQKTMQAQINSEFPSVRIIGNIEGYLYDRALAPDAFIHFQTPADRKNVKIPPEHQKAVGLIDHTQDAYRHMRYWYLMNRKKLAL